MCIKGFFGKLKEKYENYISSRKLWGFSKLYYDAMLKMKEKEAQNEELK